MQNSIMRLFFKEGTAALPISQLNNLSTHLSVYQPIHLFIFMHEQDLFRKVNKKIVAGHLWVRGTRRIRVGDWRESFL